jgi:hypothetical protein
LIRKIDQDSLLDPSRATDANPGISNAERAKRAKSWIRIETFDGFRLKVRTRNQSIGIDTNENPKGLGESFSESLGKVQKETPEYTASGGTPRVWPRAFPPPPAKVVQPTPATAGCFTTWSTPLAENAPQPFRDNQLNISVGSR